MCKGMGVVFRKMGWPKEGTLDPNKWSDLMINHKDKLGPLYKKCRQWERLANDVEWNRHNYHYKEKDNKGFVDFSDDSPIKPVTNRPVVHRPTGGIITKSLTKEDRLKIFDSSRKSPSAPLLNSSPRMILRPKRDLKRPSRYGTQMMLVSEPPSYDQVTRRSKDQGVICRDCGGCVPADESICLHCGTPITGNEPPCEDFGNTRSLGLYPVSTQITLEERNGTPLEVRRSVQHRPWTRQELRDITEKCPDHYSSFYMKKAVRSLRISCP